MIDNEKDDNSKFSLLIEELDTIREEKMVCIATQDYVAVALLRDKEMIIIKKLSFLGWIDNKDEYTNSEIDITTTIIANIQETNEPDIDIDGIDDDMMDFIIEDDEDIIEDEEQVQSDQTQKQDEEAGSKFRLKHDSIFKGRKTTEEDEETISSLYIDTFTGLGPDPEIYDSEEEQVRKTELSRLVYDIIITKTDAKLSGCRRKPARADFNVYYNCIITNIDVRMYTKTELFCELAQYFSDNYYSMLKLLQKEWSDEIINELQEKYKKFDLRKIDFF